MTADASPRRGATSRRATAHSPARTRPEIAEDMVSEKITLAILERRLRPGTKLGEDRLAAIFKVNRSRIRQALARLAQQQLVTLLPKRGAFVAAPTLEEARDLFEMRRFIEPGMLARLIAKPGSDAVRRLRAHVERELEAQRAGDRRSIVRLSGEFHILMAELTGSSILAKTMRDLVTLTSLVIFVHHSPLDLTCRVDEHNELVDAVAKRDAARAARLISEHLDHIESFLDVRRDDAHLELEDVFV